MIFFVGFWIKFGSRKLFLGKKKIPNPISKYYTIYKNCFWQHVRFIFYIYIYIVLMVKKKHFSWMCSKRPKIAPLNTLKLFVWQNVLLFFCHIHEKCFFKRFWIFSKIKRPCCWQIFCKLENIRVLDWKNIFFDVSPKKRFSGAEFDPKSYKTPKFASKKTLIDFFLFQSELLICHELKPCYILRHTIFGLPFLKTDLLHRSWTHSKRVKPFIYCVFVS